MWLLPSIGIGKAASLLTSAGKLQKASSPTIKDLENVEARCDKATDIVASSLADHNSPADVFYKGDDTWVSKGNEDQKQMICTSDKLARRKRPRSGNEYDVSFPMGSNHTKRRSWTKFEYNRIGVEMAKEGLAFDSSQLPTPWGSSKSPLFDEPQGNPTQDPQGYPNPDPQGYPTPDEQNSGQFTTPLGGVNLDLSAIFYESLGYTAYPKHYAQCDYVATDESEKTFEKKAKNENQCVTNKEMRINILSAFHEAFLCKKLDEDNSRYSPDWSNETTPKIERANENNVSSTIATEDVSTLSVDLGCSEQLDETPSSTIDLECTSTDSLQATMGANEHMTKQQKETWEEVDKANVILAKIDLPGLGSNFKPVSKGNPLFELGIMWKVSGSTIVLAESYVQRLVVQGLGSQDSDEMQDINKNAMLFCVCLLLASKMTEPLQCDLCEMLAKIAPSEKRLGSQKALKIELEYLNKLNFQLGPYFHTSCPIQK